MYIDKSTVHLKNGKSYTRYLLRQCYREQGKIKHRTLANLSACSADEVTAMQLAFKHKHDLTQITGTRPDVSSQQGKAIGAVWMLLTIAKRLGIEKALGTSEQGKLALWQVFSRIIEQGSRLSSTRLAMRHACEVLGIKEFDEDKLYNNLDWLAEHQAEIEDELFALLNKNKDTQLFLYDVTSSYLEGICNELAEFGYNRDGKKGKLQIVIGLLCDEEGTPISIEVFTGNNRDHKTLTMQIKKAAFRFGVKRVTFIGDRGMIKSAQITELEDFNFHYITAITKPQIQTLLDQGIMQLSLFDQELAEVNDHGVRYILRRNPIRMEELEKNRQDKLRALQKVIDTRNVYVQLHLQAKDSTSLKMAIEYAKKLRINAWIEITLEERQLKLKVDQEKLTATSLFDGCYVIKTDVPVEVASKEIIHRSYKDLALVEQAFRTSKTVQLEMRPIYVRLADRTRGHVFVVMLAYRIIKELTKYWQTLDVTVDEGIAALSSLCQIEITINGQSYNQIPKPDALCEKLLQLAQVTLPTVLPKAYANVTTRKKLQTERKTI